jgi:hypothetical protein
MTNPARPNRFPILMIFAGLLIASPIAFFSFAQTEPPAAAAPAGNNANQNLDDAKATFRDTVDELNAARDAKIAIATAKLTTSYNQAINTAAHNGDLDAALALRTERDSFLDGGMLPKVEQGWTILFRSADPYLFNTPVENTKSYSVPMNLAPSGTKYLRFRRMDTKDYVIIKVAFNELLQNASISNNYWWRGDKCIDNHSCELGITDQRAPNDCNVIMAMEPSGNRAGWGFGRTINGDRLGFEWADVEIDPTVFEIAVTDQNLTEEELRHFIN